MLRLVRYVCSASLSLGLTLAKVSAFAQPAAPAADVNSVSRTGSAALSAANPTEYQRVMSLGLEEFGHGHWAEARALFLRGHALSPNARSFRALGMTAFNLRRYPDALRELTYALEDPRRPLNKALTASTLALREDADTFVGRYKVQLEPASATLVVDGLSTKLEPDGELLLAVGSHWLEVEARGYVRLTRPLLVDGTDGETLRLTLVPLTLTPEQVAVSAEDAARADGPEVRSVAASSAPSPLRRAGQLFSNYRWSFLLGAGALACTAGASVLQAKANAEAQRVKEECRVDDFCSPRDDETLTRDQLRGSSIALWVTCGILTVTTIVMVLVEKGRVQQREAVTRALAR